MAFTTAIHNGEQTPTSRHGVEAEEYKGETTVLPEKDTVAGNDEEIIGDDVKRLAFDHTHRKLKPRHIQLIGIGGTIGTVLYVQIGKALMEGGPASLFLAFVIWSVLCACQSIYLIYPGPLTMLPNKPHDFLEEALDGQDSGIESETDRKRCR